MQNKVGIYVHIPFCATKCPYCDFYSEKYSGELAVKYIDVIKEHMRQYTGVKADTLYFGGGTPSLLNPDLIASVIDTAVDCFSLSGEVTIEANPNTLNEAKLSSYKNAGINRLSMGAQSINQQELTALGRTHTNNQIYSSLNTATKLGLTNISLDLMLGTPYQTARSLEATLGEIAALPITHISAYMLKVERGTPYKSSPLLDFCVDDDTLSDMYLQTVSVLEQNGLVQYEISNFCKGDKKSLHNLKYWKCEEYIGFGASAHSYFDGERFAYVSSIADYIEKKTTVHEYVDQMLEYIMLGLRLTDGISFNRIVPYMDSKRLSAKLSMLINAGFVQQNGDIISLTAQGFLLSNSIIGEVLDCYKNKSYNL